MRELQIPEPPKKFGWLRDGKIANWQIHQSTRFGQDDFVNKTLVCNPTNQATFQHLASPLNSLVAEATLGGPSALYCYSNVRKPATASTTPSH
jgi:hypothetical protein